MGIILTILFPIESDRPDSTDLVFVVAECWYKWDENIRSHLLLPGTHLNRFWRFSGAQRWSFFCSTPGGIFQSGGQTDNDLKEERSKAGAVAVAEVEDEEMFSFVPPVTRLTMTHNWEPPSFVMTISFHCWNYCIENKMHWVKNEIMKSVLSNSWMLSLSKEAADDVELRNSREPITYYRQIMIDWFFIYLFFCGEI